MSGDGQGAGEGSIAPKGLGAVWIVYGIVRFGVGIWMMAFTPIATVMFGALLVRVANPYALMADFHILYTAAICISVLCGVLGVLGGIALCAGAGAGRLLTIVASFLALSELPVGIALGVYTLLRLFPGRERRSAS